MKTFPKTATAIGLDGPEFEMQDGAYSLAETHMEALEASLIANAEAHAALEGQLNIATAKAADTALKLTEAESKLAEVNEALVTANKNNELLTLKLEDAKKKPISAATGLISTDAANAQPDTKTKHAGPAATRKVLNGKKTSED